MTAMVFRNNFDANIYIYLDMVLFVMFVVNKAKNEFFLVVDNVFG